MEIFCTYLQNILINFKKKVPKTVRLYRHFPLRQFQGNVNEIQSINSHFGYTATFTIPRGWRIKRVRLYMCMNNEWGESWRRFSFFCLTHLHRERSLKSGCLRCLNLSFKKSFHLLSKKVLHLQGLFPRKDMMNKMHIRLPLGVQNFETFLLLILNKKMTISNKIHAHKQCLQPLAVKGHARHFLFC